MKHYFLLLTVASLFLAGCASDNPPSSSTPPSYVDPTAQGKVAGMGIESQDLITATDKMSRKILETPRVQSSKGGSTPTIALIPIENRTRFPIDKDIFLQRLKALLNEKSNGQIRFIARDQLEALKNEKAAKDKGDVTSGTRKKFLGADFFLDGKFSSISTATSQGKSDYLLFTFRLIDAETSEEIWEGFHELKKEGTEDAIYR